MSSNWGFSWSHLINLPIRVISSLPVWWRGRQGRFSFINSFIHSHNSTSWFLLLFKSLFQVVSGLRHLPEQLLSICRIKGVKCFHMLFDVVFIIVIIIIKWHGEDECQRKQRHTPPVSPLSSGYHREVSHSDSQSARCSQPLSSHFTRSPRWKPPASYSALPPALQGDGEPHCTRKDTCKQTPDSMHQCWCMCNCTSTSNEAHKIQIYTECCSLNLNLLLAEFVTASLFSQDSSSRKMADMLWAWVKNCA